MMNRGEGRKEGECINSGGSRGLLFPVGVIYYHLIHILLFNLSLKNLFITYYYYHYPLIYHPYTNHIHINIITNYPQINNILKTSSHPKIFFYFTFPNSNTNLILFQFKHSTLILNIKKINKITYNNCYNFLL